MAQEFHTVDQFHDYLRNKAVEDEGFRSRLIADPKTVIEDELDMSVPDEFSIKVHEESASTAHLVLPPSAKIAEAELGAVVGGNSRMDWCSPV